MNQKDIKRDQARANEAENVKETAFLPSWTQSEESEEEVVHI
jgi:hypothetical protein